MTSDKFAAEHCNVVKQHFQFSLYIRAVKKLCTMWRPRYNIEFATATNISISDHCSKMAPESTKENTQSDIQLIILATRAMNDTRNECHEIYFNEIHIERGLAKTYE